MRGSTAAMPVLAVLLMAAGSATDVAPSPGVAPFGDQVSEQRLPFYQRVTPLIATSGPISDAGVIEAKRVGFAMIVDLRPPGSNISSGQQHAEFSRIRYVNLPVQGVPTDEQVKQFADLVAERSNLPLLLHGANIDQSGAMWALYRASLGVPANIALEDGAAAGLQASTAAVQARLAEMERKKGGQP